MILALVWARREIPLLIACILLAHGWIKSGRKYAALEASKPKIEEKIVTKTVIGPTRTITRVIEKPGAERIVEKIVEVESKVIDRASDHSETPALAPAPRVNRLVIGAGFAPQYREKLPLVTFGHSWGNRLDVDYGYVPEGIGESHIQHLLIARWRF